MFNEDLKPNTEAHTKVKRAVEVAKLKYKKQHPDEESKHQAAGAALRDSSGLGSASGVTLEQKHVAKKRHNAEMIKDGSMMKTNMDAANLNFNNIVTDLTETKDTLDNVLDSTNLIRENELVLDPLPED